jgi:hypothetical protein
MLIDIFVDVPRKRGILLDPVLCSAARNKKDPRAKNMLFQGSFPAFLFYCVFTHKFLARGSFEDGK